MQQLQRTADVALHDLDPRAEFGLIAAFRRFPGSEHFILKTDAPGRNSDFTGQLLNTVGFRLQLSKHSRQQLQIRNPAAQQARRCPSTT